MKHAINVLQGHKRTLKKLGEPQTSDIKEHITSDNQAIEHLESLKKDENNRYNMTLMMKKVGEIIDKKNWKNFEIIGWKYLEVVIKGNYSDKSEIIKLKWSNSGETILVEIFNLGPELSELKEVVKFKEISDSFDKLASEAGQLKEYSF